MKDKRGLDDAKANKAVLMKYYPKYYRRLLVDKHCRRRPVLSKVKQVKSVQDFRYVMQFGGLRMKQIVNLIRDMLLTKRKSLKFPHVTGPSPNYENCLKHEMEICRQFPRIKQLLIVINGHYLDQDIPYLLQKRDLKRYQHFWNALPCLKNLTLWIESEKIWLLTLCVPKEKFRRKNLLRLLFCTVNFRKIWQSKYPVF